GRAPPPPEAGEDRAELAPEQPRLAQVEQEAAAAEAATCKGRDGAALAAEVAARPLAAAAQQVLLRVADPPRPARARRLLDVHHHVAPPLAAGGEIGAPDALED